MHAASCRPCHTPRGRGAARTAHAFARRASGALELLLPPPDASACDALTETAKLDGSDPRAVPRSNGYLEVTEIARGTNVEDEARAQRRHRGSDKKYTKRHLFQDAAASPLAAPAPITGPQVARRMADRFLVSDGVDDETLAIAERYFADKDAGRGPAQQMMDFARSLLDESDGSTRALNKALSLPMVFSGSETDGHGDPIVIQAACGGWGRGRRRSGWQAGGARCGARGCAR
jgi:hypothetical protein